MNAGFSNLDVLKKYLLAEQFIKSKQFNDPIQFLGLGIAARIEKLLNRKLARQVGCQEILPADRGNFLLSRYPLEENPSLVEIKIDEVDGFVAQDITSSDPWWQTVDLANGLIILPDHKQGAEYFAQVRFTYTGGFFWNTLEPDDAGYPALLPAGANALPDDIRAAWLLQCADVWAQRDKLGLSIIDKPGEQAKLAQLKFSPLVSEMLQPYIRYQMT